MTTDSATARRRPWAAVALAAILAITAAWWALALWPLGTGAPEWLVRTREVCFGASRHTLPTAGGWLLLIGEPVGMIAFLVMVWGAELRTDLRRLNAHLPGRLLLMVGMAAVVLGLAGAARRVMSITGWGVREPFAVLPPLPERGTDPAPPLALVDQRGDTVRLADLRGEWTLVTFAFGHCPDVCPAIVQDTRRVRAAEGTDDLRLLIVTLDPWRDAPAQLPAIARDWGLTERDHILSGAVADVSATLDRWRIGRIRDTATGDITHGATVIVVDPEGRVAWRIDGAILRLHDALRTVARERGAAAAGAG